MTAPHNLLASAAGRRQVKAARRLVLLQCDSCSVKASGMLNAFGRLTAINVPAIKKGDDWFHVPCNRGRLVAFDLGHRA